MRVLALILAVVTLLVCGFFAYSYFYGAAMVVESVAASLTPATERQDLYDELVRQLNLGTFLGKKYRVTEMVMPDGYAFLTLTVRMVNQGLFPMDWITLEVAPDAADVLQLAADRTPTLAPRTRGEFSTVLLTRAGAGTARKITVRYYVLGKAYIAEYEM